MAILVKPDTKVLVQGITGSFGGRHTQLSLEYGSQIVAGVTPGKAGQKFQDTIPIFDGVAEAVKETSATASAIFVPPPFAADAILEAVDAGLELVVAITEGIPVRDMIEVKAAINGSATRLIGPNCPASSPPAQARIPTAAAASASPPATSIRRATSASSAAAARSRGCRGGASPARPCSRAALLEFRTRRC